MRERNRQGGGGGTIENCCDGWRDGHGCQGICHLQKRALSGGAQVLVEEGDGDEGGRTSVSRSCSLAASRRNMDTASRHSCGSKRIRREKWQGTRRGRRLRGNTLISSGVQDSDAAAAERALRVTGLPRPEQRESCEGVGQGVVQRQAYRRWTCGRTLRQFPR